MKVFTYGIGENASFRAEDIEKGDGFYRFDMKTPGETCSEHPACSARPGQYSECHCRCRRIVVSGVTPDEIRNGLLLYQGVQRRFDVRFSIKGLVYIDDYAHHPRR